MTARYSITKESLRYHIKLRGFHERRNQELYTPRDMMCVIIRLHYFLPLANKVTSENLLFFFAFSASEVHTHM